MPGLANNANPAAAIRGPTTRGALAPYRSRSPPDQRDSRNINRMKGSRAAPAFGRRVALHLYQIEREKEEHAAQRGVEKEGEQVRAAEIAGTEQAERNHRRR